MVGLAIAGVLVAATGVATVTGFQAAARQLTSYDGVQLGVPRNEVRYRWGEPNSVHGQEEAVPDAPNGWASWRRVYYFTEEADPSENKVNLVPTGKSADDFDGWSYARKAPTANPFNGSLEVEFERGRVKSVRCLEFGEGEDFCEPVLGIAPGTTEERVRRRLGRPNSEELDSTGVKTLSYRDLGLTFLLTGGKVYAVELAGPQNGSSWAILRAALTPHV